MTESAAGPRVLVAEDDPVSQQVARRMLESLGCVVDIVGTGAQVLTATRQRRYELVFMDCQMPELDGYEATAALRTGESPDEHVPVVALTASAMKGDAERCLAAGMDDYLTKPVRIADFRTTLDRWLPLAVGDPSSSPAVDGAALAALTEDHDQAASLVELFLDTSRAQLDHLRTRVAEGRHEAVRRLSHGLRGSALSLGATELAARCEVLEKGAEAGLAVPGALAAIEEEFARVAAFLSNRFGVSPAATPLTGAALTPPGRSPAAR